MRTCSACGTENPDRAKYCLECAAPLGGPDRVSGDERKVVSALFCDLVGFTAASDGADPEDIYARLGSYFAAVRADIERYGGTVEKFIGDAVVGLFGVPTVHEDDAERAVRAGLAILETIRDLTGAAGPRPLELAVRIGIATGEVVVALGARPESGAGFVTGDVMNTASRLQSVAPEGSVVVGEATYQSTRDRFRFEPMDPATVKGKREAVTRWRVVEPIGPPGGTRPLAATPFVGREDELTIVGLVVARSFRDRTAQLVTVTGEPGVGKTRFVDEVQATMQGDRSNDRWVGRCPPYGEGVTFRPVAEIVRGICAIDVAASREQAGARLADTLADLIADRGERAWTAARLAPLVGAAEPAAEGVRERETFTAWARFLVAAAQRRPTVLVIEDLHWAEQAMLAFVEHLLEYAFGVPLLVLCTARPELYERPGGWAGGIPDATAIALRPLDDDQTERLVGALLGDAALAASTRRTLIERSGGNPLYAEQFAGMVLDRGPSAEPEGHAPEVTGAETGAGLRVPETIHALIAARLDALPSDHRAILRDASVVGQTFWARALAALGNRPSEVVEEALHDLARKGFVRAGARSIVQDDDAWTFGHALFQEVAYAQLPRAVRALKHQASADWIRAAGAAAPDAAGSVAYHYARAHELATLAGDVPLAEATRGPALDATLVAADRAMGLDVAQARSAYERALALAPTGDPERGRVLMGLGRARSRSGDHPGSIEAYEEAVQCFRETGDRERLGGALRRLAAVERERGDTERARPFLDEALQILGALPAGEELCWACYLTAFDRYASGSQHDALAWADRGLAIAREHALTEVGIVLLQARGVIRCELDDPDGLRDLEEAVAAAVRTDGFDHRVPLAHENLAEGRWLGESASGALDSYRAGIGFGERRGISVAYIRAVALRPLFDLGSWDEVDVEAAAWTSSVAEGGPTYWRPLVVGYRALVDVWRGRELDRQGLELALREGRTTGDAQVLVAPLVASALSAQAAGRAGDAVALIEEFDTSTRGRFRSQRALPLTDLVRVSLWADRRDLAERLVKDAPSAFVRLGNALRTANAALAEAEGAIDTAADAYRDVADRWASYGSVLEEGFAHVGAGRCLVQLDRPRDADGHLRRAADLFTSLGAAPAAADAARTLPRSGRLGG